MLHDDLKELGVDSMGHRLTILKAIYEVKIRHKISIEIDHFVPLCKICKLSSHKFHTNYPQLLASMPPRMGASLKKISTVSYTRSSQEMLEFSQPRQSSKQ